jgi:hypothetical protein
MYVYINTCRRSQLDAKVWLQALVVAMKCMRHSCTMQTAELAPCQETYNTLCQLQGMRHTRWRGSIPVARQRFYLLKPVGTKVINSVRSHVACKKLPVAIKALRYCALACQPVSAQAVQHLFRVRCSSGIALRRLCWVHRMAIVGCITHAAQP